MTAAAPSYPHATRLAGALAQRETPSAVLSHRLAVAADVARSRAATEPLAAALVVGSTALRRCSPRADLDLVLIHPHGDPIPRFETEMRDGLKIEIERLTVTEALAATEDDGWTWELRAAARLACGLAVLDPDGFATRLQARAARQQPWPDRCEEALRGVYETLTALGDERSATPPGEGLRGCLDNLALLALLEQPRRYQKAKWVLADLLHAGELALVEATLRAYGALEDSAAATTRTLARVRSLIDAAYAAIGAPAHDDLLARGYAPDHAAASYVSRALADAEDLAASGRQIEAQYVARFAARLGGGLIAPPTAVLSLAESFALRGADLAEHYAAVFEDCPPPDTAALRTALGAADARLAALSARESREVSPA